MELAKLLDKLGYAESKNYLRQDKGDFNGVVDYGHLFRRAARDPCHLRGVYALRESRKVSIPLVYVCEAESEADAEEVHRLVWNQDTVPFLIINSPETVRVYPGFCRGHAHRKERAVETVLEVFDGTDLNRIAQTLHADAVDSGRTWTEWGQHIRPEHKVDWRLLGNLKGLDTWLKEEGGLAPKFSHALIGKYVYLHYLRDRGILSPRKLDKWDIPEKAVFGRGATVEGLRALQEKLDEWLNGEVFAIDFGRRGTPRDKHVARVAGTFKGDKPVGGGRWQLHLDFKAYNFSYIPIEVLSIIYEQFLHSADGRGSKTKGRSAGAYYTPIPVVNFMLSELEERRPLTRGMRVFDSACGSGAFLVQAFRRLIEKEFPPGGPRPGPVDLRELLKDHFFGLDTDPDACSVTELSLILTLLDYVHPPDLENGQPGPNPRLPNLRKENIFCGNFFDEDADRQRILARKKFDWVVGNPPWKQLKSTNIEEQDKPVLRWIVGNEKERPVGNRQMARAFAWRVADHVGDDGEIALFLPAMSLFESAATRFRAKFFEQMQVHSIANFSNLRWVISAGRFTAPAAIFIYRPRKDGEESVNDEIVRMYSPLIANQEATRPAVEGKRNESWSIVINASEIKDVPLSNAANGNSLVWKLASWGSELDARLIRSLRRRFPSLGDLEREGLLLMSEGLQLRSQGTSKDTDPVPEAANAKTIELPKVKGLRDFFAFPPNAICNVAQELTHARKNRAGLPLSVCRSPHIIVSAARNFAVYSEEFLIVPPRQIGIVSPSDDSHLLKLLSLFLSSDFAFYHQFLVSAGFGVERDRSTLRALREIPMPLTEMGGHRLRAWAKLHDDLVRNTEDAFGRERLFGDGEARHTTRLRPVVDQELLKQLNARVYEALGLCAKERALVHDLVRVRLELNNGRLGQEAVRGLSTRELRRYANRLRSELDSFVEGELPKQHQVDVIHDDASGMVRVDLVKGTRARRQVSVSRADASGAGALEKCRARLRRKRSQWVYFDRNLRVYEGTCTYVLKPMQRFHWTETQARLDAREIIAESMGRGD